MTECICVAMDAEYLELKRNGTFSEAAVNAVNAVNAKGVLFTRNGPLAARTTQLSFTQTEGETFLPRAFIYIQLHVFIM